MTKLDDRIVDLERENTELRRRLDEALAQHAATTEVLQVINSSPGELAPVFDAIIARAMRFCEAAFGMLLRFDGEAFHTVAHRGLPVEFAHFIENAGGSGWRDAHLHLIDGAPFVHVLDLSEDRATYDTVAMRRALVDLGGARSFVLVPLRHEEELLGSLAIYRQETRPFSNRQIALLGEFAEQAVLAIANVRLAAETREALARQTATAEVLGVINASAGALQPVFDAILEKAHQLCGATRGTLFLFDGSVFCGVASLGYGRGASERPLTVALSEDPRLAALHAGEPLIHVSDLTQFDDPIARAVSARGVRTNLLLPLRKDGVLLGVLSCNRNEVQPFSDKEIALLQNFAAQAAIAMENARLLTETRGALERQTATSDILRVIAAAPGDAEGTLRKIAETTARLFEATGAGFMIAEGDEFTLTIGIGDGPAQVVAALYGPGKSHPPVSAPTLPGMVIREDRQIHLPDLDNLPAEFADLPGPPIMRAAGIRALVGTPLRREGQAIGALIIQRDKPRPFASEELHLLQSFADQAVIAIENARLINETRERTAELQNSLEYQTATSDLLKLISHSTFDLQPILETVIETAACLCKAEKGALFRLRDGAYRYAAGISNEPDYERIERATAYHIGEDSAVGRAALYRRVVHIVDPLADLAYAFKDEVRVGRIGTILTVPLLREGEPIGVVGLARERIEAFSDEEIELVATFADQAVIAIENTRLLTETREALEQQTATAEVLGVINSSPGDLTPVFEAMVDKARRLCDANSGHFALPVGDDFRTAVVSAMSPEMEAAIRAQSYAPGRGTAVGRALMERRPVMIADIGADPEHAARHAAEQGMIRTILGVPLLREGEPIGAFGLSRTRVEPFTERQIALVQNFAAQAVIAMENARLLGELRDRTEDLAESLEYQTATSDVLKVISQSTFDLQSILDTLFDTAAGLCNAEMGHITRREGDVYRVASTLGLNADWDAAVRNMTFRAGDGTTVGRTVMAREAVQIADVSVDPAFPLPELTRIGRIRTSLGVPLLREGEPIGVISLARTRVESFTIKQIELVRTFADQAVIAIENARLFGELRAARDTAEGALRDLQAAQGRLIQTEKMASLGQLTAGIAHEIKNPLNFVNNFAALSNELLAELKEVASPALAALGADRRAEAEETIGLLTGNLEKIAEHGRRADNIVKSMLEHSRGVSGERRAVDLNGLVEEALNLAYHGARAQDQGFNITLERDFAAGLAPVELVPQDMTRVFLNLFGNGFYAATKRARQSGNGFRAVLKVATAEKGDAVEVRVRDNGTGIPAAIRDKLFQPFFTTKPTGEGTGLGLSISYDIVTQQHGGTIAVESAEDEFTEFTIRLPRQGTDQGTSQPGRSGRAA